MEEEVHIAASEWHTSRHGVKILRFGEIVDLVEEFLGGDAATRYETCWTSKSSNGSCSLFSWIVPCDILSSVALQQGHRWT